MARRGRDRKFIEPPEEEKKSEISYMQPEILPIQIMETILKERGMSPTVLANADRKLFIKLFFKHVSPKYQRDYRDNRRGKILKKVRQKRERKIDTEDWKKKLLIDPKSIKSDSHSSSSYYSSSRDRLKPPPSSQKSINLDDIVIKDHKVKSNRDSDRDRDKDKKRKNLDEIVIRDHKVRSRDEEHRDTKKVTVSSSSEKRKSEQDSKGSEKKIKLKRDVSWP